jgi:hypothetical protein
MRYGVYVRDDVIASHGVEWPVDTPLRVTKRNCMRIHKGWRRWL